MKKNFLIIASIFIGIMITAVYIFSTNEKNNKQQNTTFSREQYSLLNNQIPDAKILDSNSLEKSILDFKAEKPIFMMYWASWCPDCRKQLPDVEKLYREYKDKVNFVLINVMDGNQETIEQARAYIKEKNYTFDYYRSTDEVLEKFKIKTIPTKFIINKKGIIDEVRSEKYTDYSSLKKSIDAVLDI